MLRSILVALDGSAFSEPSTTVALDSAARFGARLLGLGVLEVVTIHRDGAVAEATAHLAGAFLTAHGARHRLHPVASGVAPAKVLLEH